MANVLTITMVANANDALASGNYARGTASSGFCNPNDVFHTLTPSAREGSESSPA